MAKAQKEKPRQPIDFDQMDVKERHKVITDPDKIQELGGVEYPKHLHRYAGPGMAHEYVEVVDADDEADKREEGFGSAQDADAVGRAEKLKLKAPAAAPSKSAQDKAGKRAQRKPAKKPAAKAAKPAAARAEK